MEVNYFLDLCCDSVNASVITCSNTCEPPLFTQGLVFRIFSSKGDPVTITTNKVEKEEEEEGVGEVLLGSYSCLRIGILFTCYSCSMKFKPSMGSCDGCNVRGEAGIVCSNCGSILVDINPIVKSNKLVNGYIPVFCDFFIVLHRSIIFKLILLMHVNCISMSISMREF